MLSWRSRTGVVLNDDDISRLVSALGLKPLRSSEPGRPVEATQTGNASPEPPTLLGSTNDNLCPHCGAELPEKDVNFCYRCLRFPVPTSELDEMGTMLLGDNATPQQAAALAVRVAVRLSRRIRELEAALAIQRGESRASNVHVEPAVPAVRRPWTDEEKAAVRDAVTAARLNGKSRALPTILEYMNRALGYNLPETRYNGFGTAKAMFEQAVEDGIVKFGEYRGPNPTVYLPEEVITV